MPLSPLDLSDENDWLVKKSNSWTMKEVNKKGTWQNEVER